MMTNSASWESASPSSPAADRLEQFNRGYGGYPGADPSLGNLQYYVVEDESGIRGRGDAPDSPMPAPKAARGKGKKATTADDKPAAKSSKGKTPMEKPGPASQAQPVRKSARTNAGTKRKSFGASSDTEDKAFSSPLIKKAKTTKDMTASPTPSKAEPTAPDSDVEKQASPVLKKPKSPVLKLKALPKSKAGAIKPVAEPSKKAARMLDGDDDESVDLDSAEAAPKKGKLPKVKSAALKSKAGSSKKRARTPDEADEESAASGSDQAPPAKKSKSSKAKAAAPKPKAGPSKKRARIADKDDEESAASESDRPRKAKKTKKSKANDDSEELKQFETTANKTGMGSSSERPGVATLQQPWKCANRMCNTGMTWLNRGDGDEKSAGYGRKACSHWFGRNKKETGYIHAEVWHYFCRKCYQRQAYQARKPNDDANVNNLVKQHVDDLRNQIIRMALWRPDMTFKVQLNKGANDRLSEYVKQVARTSKVEAVEAVKFTGGQTNKGKAKKPRNEDTFPIDQIDKFDRKFRGDDRTLSDLRDICRWIDELNEAGNAPCDPPIEFLPSAQADGERVIDPVGTPDNYDRWAQHCDAAAARSSASDNGDEEAEIEAAANEDPSSAVAEQDSKDDSDSGADDEELIEQGHDGVDDEDEQPLEPEATDSDSGAENSGDDDDHDALPPPHSYKKPSGARLYITPLGKQLGLKGTAGIFPGSGLIEDRVAEAREFAAAREAAGRRANEREAAEHRAALDAQADEADGESAEAADDDEGGVSIKTES